LGRVVAGGSEFTFMFGSGFHIGISSESI
jgi:hypothetical protein